MRMLVLTLLTFKKVKLIFGHPVSTNGSIGHLFSCKCDSDLKLTLMKRS